MTCDADEGAPSWPKKRSFDEIPVGFDWHDFLARLPERGTAVALGDKVRLTRTRSTGFQYECTAAGVTGPTEPRWPEIADATVKDGSAEWTAKAMAAASLRTTVSSHEFSADPGVTLGAEGVSDLRYSVIVEGGESGTEYEIKHRIVCANGEEKEAVGTLLVQD